MNDSIYTGRTISTKPPGILRRSASLSSNASSNIEPLKKYTDRRSDNDNSWAPYDDIDRRNDIDSVPSLSVASSVSFMSSRSMSPVVGPVYEDLDDALVEMKKNIFSLRSFLGVTNNLCSLSQQRVEELEDQKIIAMNEIVHWKRQMQIAVQPEKKQASLIGMVDFYKKQLTSSQRNLNEANEIVFNLERVLANIDMDLFLAKAEEHKYKESVMKLENDISALEYCLEEEKNEKVTILSFLEDERKSGARFNYQNDSDINITELQKNLNTALRKSTGIVKKNEKEYERKIHDLQTQLNDTQQKVEECQNELSKKLYESQEALMNSLSFPLREKKKQLETCEDRENTIKNQIILLDAATEKHDKEVEEKKLHQQRIIYSLKQELELEYNLKTETNRTQKLGDNQLKSLKEDLFQKEKTIFDNNIKISELQRKSRDLHKELKEQVVKASKELLRLRTEMTAKVQSAELDAAGKLKAVKDKMESMRNTNKETLAKKENVACSLAEEYEAVSLKMQANEQQFDEKLWRLKEKMTERLLKAEKQANSALEEATWKLQSLEVERVRKTTAQDLVIQKLQNNIPAKYRDRILGSVRE